MKLTPQLIETFSPEFIESLDPLARHVVEKLREMASIKPGCRGPPLRPKASQAVISSQEGSKNERS